MKAGDTVVVIRNTENSRALDGKNMLKPGDMITIHSITDGRISYEINEGYMNIISLKNVKPPDNNIDWKNVKVTTGKFK